jgi:hypothetical protein
VTVLLQTFSNAINNYLNTGDNTASGRVHSGIHNAVTFVAMGMYLKYTELRGQ